MKIFGLLGKNIAYSSSPSMHNAAFRALGIDAEYRLFDMKREKLNSFFQDIKKGIIEGCNVTIPHKEESLKFVDKKSEIVEATGALNTVARKTNILVADNTDFIGFMKALRGNTEGDLHFDPKGKNVFLFGAGGAAKAIAYTLITLKAKRIIIADIDKSRAENLAGSFFEKKSSDVVLSVAEDEVQYEDFISKSDLLINATPCGMKNDDPELFDYRYIEDKHFVFDLIYTKETKLLKRAKSQGAQAIDGLNMLLYQAGASFNIWTGKEAPIKVMKEELLKHRGK